MPPNGGHGSENQYCPSMLPGDTKSNQGTGSPHNNSAGEQFFSREIMGEIIVP